MPNGAPHEDEDLTPQAKWLIVRFIGAWFAVPAIIIAGLSFYLGMVVKEVAMQNATAKALEDTVKPVIDAGVAIEMAKNRAQQATADAKAAGEIAKQIADENQKRAEALKSIPQVQAALTNQENLVKSVADSLFPMVKEQVLTQIRSEMVKLNVPVRLASGIDGASVLDVSANSIHLGTPSPGRNIYQDWYIRLAPQ